MTPFSQLLYEFRMRNGVRQIDLAVKLACEQSYLSALESDLRGPPAQKTMDRLVQALVLSEEDKARLFQAADASTRKFVVDRDLPEDVYWMLSELRHELKNLSLAHVQMIRALLKTRIQDDPQVPTPYPRRLRRRQREEATM